MFHVEHAKLKIMAEKKQEQINTIPVYAEGVTHADVRGQLKFYVRLKSEKGEYVINVGVKTVNECRKLAGLEPISEIE